MASDSQTSGSNGRLFSRETERNLNALEDLIRTLSSVCERLSAEHTNLSVERERLSAEQSTLRADNRRNRARIDAMVTRLKDLKIPV